MCAAMWSDGVVAWEHAARISRISCMHDSWNRLAVRSDDWVTKWAGFNSSIARSTITHAMHTVLSKSTKIRLPVLHCHMSGSQ